MLNKSRVPLEFSARLVIPAVLAFVRTIVRRCRLDRDLRFALWLQLEALSETKYTSVSSQIHPRARAVRSSIAARLLLPFTVTLSFEIVK